MTAVLVPTSSEAEWLAARRNGITASEIGIIMGLSPYSSPYKLFHQKTGDLPEEDDNISLAIGRHFEDFVADRFAERRPELYVHGDGRALWKRADRPWQMATPDRLVDEVWFEPDDSPALIHEERKTLAVLECKTDGGFDGWGEDGTDEIPVHYRCQVLWQMDVMGVQTGFVACLFMNRRQLRVYEITADGGTNADLAIMRAEAAQFLARIETGTPPDLDWRPATSETLKRLHPDVEDRDVIIPSTLGRRYRSACAALRKAENRRDLALNQIRARVGSGRRAVLPDGEVIARRDVYDLAEKQITRKASHVDRIVPVKPKEPKQ